jgi:DNA (cytosine-5)-methyltransferase 1
MLNGLDLFSGIGGITLALGDWVRPVAYCERDRFCQAELMSRIADRQLPRAPVWDDVTTLNGHGMPIDIIYGGFPCQDISAAGYGVGLGGERSGLFNHIARLIKETNPKFVFLENVPAIRTRGLNCVAQTFTELGYDYRWTIVSAKEVGACHIRKRWFMLAHAHGAELRPQPGRSRGKKRTAKNVDRLDGSPRTYTDTNGPGLERFWRNESRIPRPAIYNGWSSQPTIRRRNNGIPFRMDRIKALGNSVVPAQAREAFMRLMGLKNTANTAGAKDECTEKCN